MGFMTWEGYNYEDAVLLNERMVREDVFTSIHIEEYELEARDTKLGPETITRDIPNVGEDALRDLDEHGIIRIGHAGDYLVGKVAPKGEAEATAEEKLLRAIFGEKAREVRDTSLKVPHGESGTIVDVKIFTRENGDELGPGVNQCVRVYIAQKRKISVGDKMAGRHGNKGVVSRILPQEDMPFLPDGTPLDIVLNPLGVPSRMNIGQVLEVHLGYAAKTLGWKVATPIFNGATEEDIQECLKMAGLAREVGYDEPLIGKQLYLPDETAENGIRPLTPEEMEDKGQVREWQKAGQLRLVDGKNWLYDGRTGRRFDNPVTVGYVYFLKLHHLVDDKIHARGPGGLRRRLHPAGDSDGEVRRRHRPCEDLRGHRQGAQCAQARRARVLQGTHQGAPVPVSGHEGAGRRGQRDRAQGRGRGHLSARQPGRLL